MWQQLKWLKAICSVQETWSAVQFVRQLVRVWSSIACSKQLESGWIDSRYIEVWRLPVIQCALQYEDCTMTNAFQRTVQMYKHLHERYHGMMIDLAKRFAVCRWSCRSVDRCWSLESIHSAKSVEALQNHNKRVGPGRTAFIFDVHLVVSKRCQAVQELLAWRKSWCKPWTWCSIFSKGYELSCIWSHIWRWSLMILKLFWNL